MYRTLLTVIVLSSLIPACVVPQQPLPPGAAETGEEGPGAEGIEEVAEVAIDLVDTERERYIADTLFEGLQALDRDQLLTPVDDSAHNRFRRALALDPGNEIALQGLRDIVLRYVELARRAISQGLFIEAEELLDNARFVEEDHPEIAVAAQELQEEMESDDLFFNLDNQAIARKSEAVIEKLGEIADQAKRHEAFFLITAPSDEQARWMFSVMREAVGEYRLRGNIELASRTSVRLRLPAD